MELEVEQRLYELEQEIRTSETCPEALVPQLNAAGEKGWELVHIQPVVAGKKLDIEMFGHEESMFAEWTSTYFCVFKRRLRHT